MNDMRAVRGSRSIAERCPNPSRLSFERQLHAVKRPTVVTPSDPMVRRDIYQRLGCFWANLSDRLGNRLSSDRSQIYERLLAVSPHFPRMELESAGPAFPSLNIWRDSIC